MMIPEMRRLLTDGKTVKILNYPKKYPATMGIRYKTATGMKSERVNLGEGHDPTKITNFITPVAEFFTRKHFDFPDINENTWQLRLEGLFQNETSLSMEDIKRFKKVTRVVTFECTGNQIFERFHYGKQTTRFLKESTFNKLMRFLDPVQLPVTIRIMVRLVQGLGITAGNMFHNGIFTGAKLFDIFDAYGLRSEAKEIVFEGIDKGHDMLTQRISRTEVNYARSFEIQELKKYEPILCYEMNNAPLSAEHGYPLRIIIPGVYGHEHVKWLGRIIAISEKHKGYFQTEYYGYKVDGEIIPVHEQRPKSMVIKVLKKDMKITVYGVAWRGTSPIEKVEVSIDDLNTWKSSVLLCSGVDNSWLFWKYDLPHHLKGKVTIVPRAFCANGDSQPIKPGEYSTVYGNNSVISAVVKL